MRNNLWFIACLAIIPAMIISSCGPAPTSTVEPTQANQPQPTQGSLPQPTQAVPTAQVAPTKAIPVSTIANPYPGPNVPIEYLTTINPYPAPAQGEKIEWNKVAALLAGGGVSDVLQSHTLTVVVNMNDGTVYVAVEPAKDEIFKLLDQCGGACANVRRVSEFFY